MKHFLKHPGKPGLSEDSSGVQSQGHPLLVISQYLWELTTGSLLLIKWIYLLWCNTNHSSSTLPGEDKLSSILLQEHCTYLKLAVLNDFMMKTSEQNWLSLLLQLKLQFAPPEPFSPLWSPFQSLLRRSWCVHFECLPSCTFLFIFCRSASISTRSAWKQEMKSVPHIVSTAWGMFEQPRHKLALNRNLAIWPKLCVIPF